MKPHGFRSALSPFAGFFLFLLLIRTRNFVDPVLNNMGAQRLGSYTPAVVISLLPILFSFGVLVYQNGSVSGALEELGLRANIPLAALFGFCATLPALVGFALTVQIDHDLSATALVFQAVYVPFCEEILFRGLAFGLLYRRAGWNFWLSAIMPAIIFAACHLHAATGLTDVLGLFAVTGAGGLLFAYFFVRFRWNLWVPIALHAFLNTWWFVFKISHNAVGGWSDNVFRLLSITLAFGMVWLLPKTVPWTARAVGKLHQRYAGWMLN